MVSKYSFSGVFSKYIYRQKIIDRIHDVNLNDVGIIVVIPAYLEEDYIFFCINSLFNANVVTTKIEVFIVINASEAASADVINKQEELYRQIKAFSEKNNSSRINFIPVREFSIKKKHFGVGYARKAGMDQAVLRYLNKDKYGGVIVSLDADSPVAPNYFEEIEKYFSVDENMGCSIYFEHPLAGDLDSGLYKAIEQYELHLRYYKTALHETGFPYAFYTVGSSFAIRASQYVRAGGMPRKQAGEDFYLIQKVVQMGGYGELNSTCVYPSARPSSRVPFGTGPSVKRMVEEKTEYLTYNLLAFHDLKKLFEKSATLYKISKNDFEICVDSLPKRLKNFLIQDGFYDELTHLNNNCASNEVFNKRFFELFNAFKVVKYLNYVHNDMLQKVPVTKAALLLLNEIKIKTPEHPDAKKLLHIYRDVDRNDSL